MYLETSDGQNLHIIFMQFSICQELKEREQMYGRHLLENQTIMVPKNCQTSTIRVSVSAKSDRWKQAEPFPSIQSWNSKLRQITQVWSIYNI